MERGVKVHPDFWKHRQSWESCVCLRVGWGCKRELDKRPATQLVAVDYV